MKKIIVTIAMTLLLISVPLLWAQGIRIYTTASATMTAPGTSSAVWCAGFSKLIWYYKIASINTSVAITLQAKGGDSQWTNVFTDSLVYTSNGNFGVEWENVSTADSVRLQFLSEKGGSTATVTHNAKLSGGN